MPRSPAALVSSTSRSGHPSVSANDWPASSCDWGRCPKRWLLTVTRHGDDRARAFDVGGIDREGAAYPDVQPSCHRLADEARRSSARWSGQGDKGRLEALLAEMAQCAEWSLVAGDPHDSAQGPLDWGDRALDAIEVSSGSGTPARAEIRRHIAGAREHRSPRAVLRRLPSERDELRSQHHRQDCGDVGRALVERNAVLFRQVEAMRAVVDRRRARRRQPHRVHSRTTMRPATWCPQAA